MRQEAGHVRHFESFIRSPIVVAATRPAARGAAAERGQRRRFALDVGNVGGAAHRGTQLVVGTPQR
ncbi:hypothetical protein XFF6992_530008 [Xanthomonas citri pv. fuscans]|nr:hypothetical protein XFF6992_530008 [Xanthomonas citri pv. fuscans]SOO35305.1 hypothetical protein XFF6994_5200002 [Xanthomonas citri pv. fuscans]